MQLLASSKNLQIHSVKDGDEVMITNQTADHVFKRLMLTKEEARTIRILLSTIDDDDDDDKEN